MAQRDLVRTLVVLGAVGVGAYLLYRYAIAPAGAASPGGRMLPGPGGQQGGGGTPGQGAGGTPGGGGGQGTPGLTAQTPYGNFSIPRGFFGTSADQQTPTRGGMLMQRGAPQGGGGGTPGFGGGTPGGTNPFANYTPSFPGTLGTPGWVPAAGGTPAGTQAAMGTVGTAAGTVGGATQVPFRFAA